jgi:hypothetical protein
MRVARRGLMAAAMAMAAGCDAPGTPTVELGDAVANVRRHAVAFDGADYAVAWTTSSPALTGDRLWFARVSPDAEPVLPATPVLDLPLPVGELQLVAIPGRYVAWYREADNSSANLFALPLDADGELLGEAVDLGDVDGAGRQFAVTWTGDRFAVVAQKDPATLEEVHIAFYGADLALAGETVVETSTLSQYEPGVAWVTADQQAVVAWHEDDLVHAARVAADGLLVGPSAVLGDLGAAQVAPAVAADAGGVLVRWTEAGERRARFASAVGAAWRLHPTLVPDNRYDAIAPQVAVRGGRGTIAWVSDAETALPQIRVGQLDLAAGVALTGEASLTSGRWPYGEPRIAAGTSEVAVTYTGAVEGAVRLYLAIVE